MYSTLLMYNFSGRHTNIIQCSTLKYTLKNDSCTAQHIMHCKENLFSFLDSTYSARHILTIFKLYHVLERSNSSLPEVHMYRRRVEH